MNKCFPSISSQMLHFIKSFEAEILLTEAEANLIQLFRCKGTLELTLLETLFYISTLKVLW